MKALPVNIRHYRVAFLTFAVFTCALTLRLFALSQEAINPDEYHWHGRTNRFSHAVFEGRWEDTMMSGHPGATVTWQSLLSLRSLRVLYRIQDPTFDYQDYPYLTETFPRVHFAYVLPIALLSSGLIALLFYTLLRLTTASLAFITTAFLLTDPYVLAQSRMVQMDVLQATYLLFSLLSALMYHHSKKKRYFALSALTMSFAAMTKIYALSLLPLVGVILILPELQRVRTKTRAALTVITKKAITFTLIALATTALLLPAIVANPEDVFTQFQRSIFQEGLEGEWEGTEFFFGKLYDKGEPKTFYPISFLFRQSIPVMIFFPLGIAALLLKKGDGRSRRYIGLFLGIALYWTTILSIPTKMEDRYIILTHIFFNIVAAYGAVVLLPHVVVTRMGKMKREYFVLAGSFLILILTLRPLKGEYLGYYNPFMGGSLHASNFIRVGWGEGIRGLANTLNTSTEHNPDAIIAAWYESSLEPFCECRVIPTFAWEDAAVSGVVFYRNQVQRIREEAMLESLFHEENIVATESLNGVPYAWLVRKGL